MKLLHLAPNLRTQIVLAGQGKLVAAGKNLLALVAQHIAHHRVVLLAAQQQANGRVVALGSHFAVVVVHVQLHLPQVAMGQLANLQVDHHVALELDVVENQVGVKMVSIQRQPPLPPHKGKTTAQLQQKGLQLVDQRFFNARLHQTVRFWQVQKLQHVGVFDHIVRTVQRLPFVGQRQHALLVAALGKALKQKGMHLPLQLPGRPAVAHGLDFIKIAHGLALFFQQGAVVRP